jgi:hypothetical protein
MKIKRNISLTSKVQRNPGMITSNLDGEIVMMSVEHGEYYGLDEIGTRIWELLEKPITVEELISSLTHEFEVERLECEHDTLEFLDELLSKKLIQIMMK